ncbi:hypothetical protein BJF93_00860 [Xaviernesmea oryzae]|uniref:Uncharacterized protein n=1 Tax=Xaviernesmea oryzae TaxID=464029 RepID=A0A1Q9B0M5_9HYPH|nr:hypothetical protein BJF93_00860 [Xaviernesmea oryzae]SEL66841.1 hypothetical protein SAMN04487976_11116 [Xaviernesmea oryzae]
MFACAVHAEIGTQGGCQTSQLISQTLALNTMAIGLNEPDDERRYVELCNLNAYRSAVFQRALRPYPILRL